MKTIADSSVLLLYYRIFVAVSVIGAVMIRKAHKPLHFVLVKVNIADIAVIFVVIAVIGAGFAA